MLINWEYDHNNDCSAVVVDYELDVYASSEAGAYTFVARYRKEDIGTGEVSNIELAKAIAAAIVETHVRILYAL